MDNVNTSPVLVKSYFCNESIIFDLIILSQRGGFCTDFDQWKWQIGWKVGYIWYTMASMPCSMHFRIEISFSFTTEEKMRDLFRLLFKFGQRLFPLFQNSVSPSFFCDVHHQPYLRPRWGNETDPWSIGINLDVYCRV